MSIFSAIKTIFVRQPVYKAGGEFHKEFDAFMVFVKWQTNFVQKNADGSIFFEDEWHQALYLNFMMAAIERLSKTIKVSWKGKEFFEYMSGIVMEESFTNLDYGRDCILAYRCHNNDEIYSANTAGEEAMQILFDIASGERGHTAMGAKAYMLHDILDLTIG